MDTNEERICSIYLGAMLCTTSSWFEGGPYIFTLEVAIVRLNERGMFSILKRLIKIIELKKGLIVRVERRDRGFDSL